MEVVTNVNWKLLSAATHGCSELQACMMQHAQGPFIEIGGIKSTIGFAPVIPDNMLLTTVPLSMYGIVTCRMRCKLDEVIVPPALVGLSPCGASHPSASSGLSTMACSIVMRC